MLRYPLRHYSYLSATRHPWPCLLFLLPLLAAYESGVLWLGGTHPEALRTGADTWLHWCLEAFGFQQLYWVPALIVAVLLVWSLARREDRPEDILGTCTGMALESIFCALGLWGLSRGFGSLMEGLALGVEGAVGDVPGDPSQAEPSLAQLITFVGAGIYEEVLFRLLLFCGLIWLLRSVGLPLLASLVLAAFTASLSFAAAHHLGPYGESFDVLAFSFRTLAGLYFTLLFLCRGFGVAVGTHVCYDVLVGMAVA